MTISDILLPTQVNLALNAKDQAGGVEEVLMRLKGDPRIEDWDALKKAVIKRNAPAFSCNGCGVCIAHGRTNAVHSLVVGAGRSARGLVSSDTKELVRLIFVVGVPSMLDSEYLRMVGTIARLCREESILNKLLTAKDPHRFIEMLATGETKS